MSHVAALPRRAGTALLAAACALLLCSIGRPVWAWGDEGHEVIGIIADHYLEPAVRARVLEFLRRDDTGLVEHDMAHESTWADKYRGLGPRRGQAPVSRHPGLALRRSRNQAA